MVEYQWNYTGKWILYWLLLIKRARHGTMACTYFSLHQERKNAYSSNEASELSRWGKNLISMRALLSDSNRGPNMQCLSPHGHDASPPLSKIDWQVRKDLRGRAGGPSFSNRHTQMQCCQRGGQLFCRRASAS
jgi:hypothetical protein